MESDLVTASEEDTETNIVLIRTRGGSAERLCSRLAQAGRRIGKRIARWFTNLCQLRGR